jgi:hypothetical protein
VPSARAADAGAAAELKTKSDAAAHTQSSDVIRAMAAAACATQRLGEGLDAGC